MSNRLKEMSDSYELYQQCKLERDLLKEEIQKRDELLNTALKHLDMAYKWGLWLYESEDYQEMEDDDEKDNMKSDLNIVCSFLNTNKGSER